MHYSRITRFVEKYAGMAVCFVFSLLHAFSFRRQRTSIKTVLFIELVEMGAATMAYSSLRHVRKEIPDARIMCLCLASKKDSWLLLDELAAEDVFVIDDRSMRTFLPSLLQQVRALSKLRIDLIIDLDLFLRISAIIAYLIRAKYRAGFFRYRMEGLYRGTFYDIKCAFNQNMHIAKNYLALTKAAVSLSERYYNFDGPIGNDEIVTPSYASVQDEAERLRESIGADGPYILVAPTVGKALPVRDYPKEQYVEVIRMLLAQYPEHRILLVGMPAHREVCEYIDGEVRSERCINFAGKTGSLAQMMELLAMSDLLISNDSGNPHFAAFVGLPSLAIFGPETPFMYGPLGKAVCMYSFFHSMPSITAYNHKDPVVEQTSALSSIPPHEVFEMAKLIMEGKATYGTINNSIPYLL